MSAPHHTHGTTVYGSPTFAASLAEREAALGLAGITQTTQDVTQVDCATGPCDGDASAMNPQDAAPPMGDMGLRRDAWGNVVTSAPRLDSAYTFVCRTWEPGGRVVYVCGSPAAHVAAGHWTLDGRMSAGQGYVCVRCWADVARRWGIGREWRR